MTEHDKKMFEKGFDHPCRETCSGWKQGYDRGQYDSQAASRESLTAAEDLLKEVMECMKGPIIKTGILVKIKTYLNGRQ